MDFLSEIIGLKKVRLARAKQGSDLDELRKTALDFRRKSGSHALLAALKKKGINIVAEIKRASPSRGVIREVSDVADLARSFQTGGAVAISIVTEEDRFQGTLNDLREARSAVSLPILRKDFIIDEFQLYESAAAGADALLLIAAALDDATLARLRFVTEHELGMDALIEVHSSDELRRANDCGARLIGVNNRDLHTFEVSLNVSLELVREMSLDALFVSESGIRSRDDLNRLYRLGYRGFLIGESLLRADDPAQALRKMLDGNEK